MFAEELAGNAGRKRAEANRAKRRQLIQKKTQPPPSTTPKTASGSPSAAVTTRDAASGTALPSSNAVSAVPQPASSMQTINTATTNNPLLQAEQQQQSASHLRMTPTVTLAATVAVTGTTTSTKPLTALERAEEQRALRAREARQRQAGIQIQTFCRRFHSNLVLRQQNEELLQNRLGDLQTLSTILKQRKGISYVPPPATATNLVRILLHLAYCYKANRIESSSEVTPIKTLRLPARAGKYNHLLQQMIQLCFLPSLKIKDNTNSADKNSRMGEADDDHEMNPFRVWLQSKEGQWRFKTLLHFCMVVLCHPKSSDACFSSCVEFLRAITTSRASNSSTGARAATSASSSGQGDDYINFARSLLNPIGRIRRDLIIPPTLSKQQQKQKDSTYEKDPFPASSRGERMLAPIYDTSTLGSVDLTAILRYYLLFLVDTGSMPIPPQAESLRQGCISDQTKQRAGVLLQFAWESQDCPDGRRFLTHILTVPLLLWKLSSNALSFLLTCCSQTGIPPFLDMVCSFNGHCAHHDAPPVDAVLPSEDVPLTMCPATNTQCLLANLVQLGRLSTHVNGGSVKAIVYNWTQSFIDLLSVVLDAIPVRTFSTRESAVIWISEEGGHSTPIVLSVVVLDQCKALFVDSSIRNLLNCAIDAKRLDIEKVLQAKDDKDREAEQELAAELGLSAMSLAAKESRMDRNKSFWNSSHWARKVSKRVVGLLSSSSSPPGNARIKNSDNDGTTGALRNVTSHSRSLASGSDDTAAEGSNSCSREDYSPELLISLCAMFSVVLARWGGGGGRDEIAGKSGTNRENRKRADQETTTSFPEPFTLSLLNAICFSTQLLKAAWCLIQSQDSTVAAAVHAMVDPDSGKIPVRKWICIPYNSPTNYSMLGMCRGAAVLYMFAATLSHTLIVTDDAEIHDFDRPLPIHQLRRVIRILKKLLYRACSVDIDPGTESASTYFGLAMVNASSRSFRDLYDRSSRRPLCPPKAWLESGLLESEITACRTHADYVSLLNSAPVMRICPMLVSFKRRLQLFDKIVRTNREELQGVNSPNPFNANPLKPARVTVIHRNRILEDGLATMNHLGSRMRERIAVHYVNEAGVKETGIDAGGLFKEFWVDLCGIAFDANYALFQVTESAGHCIYPSPRSFSAHGRDHVVLFEFLGRILGKALYEGITIQPRFAHFFLSFLRGDYNFLHMLPDLSTIDAQLYNNLMFLKTYDGDASDLSLTFTVTQDLFGGTREIPLIPNGSNIEVTNSNKQRYIGLVAKYYVVDQIKDQSEAFTRGLWDVVDPTWLRLFNEPELQVLISGASTDGKLDVDDLRRHARYAGGYTAIDRNVARFWKVLASLDARHQAALLRFVTSCERPPPLGFASLNPPFTIQRVGILRDGDKLPTASTCFNILKLPTYSSEKVLRERLIYAVESGAGFELT